MGLEPTTNGITIRYSNQLSYNHRFRAANIKQQRNNSNNF